MVPLAAEWRILDHGVGVVEHDVGEIARRDILQHDHHFLLLRSGKNVKRGRMA